MPNNPVEVRPIKHRLLKTREVAEMFSCSVERIGQLCREGILVADRPGRHWRVRRDSVEAVLESKQAEKDLLTTRAVAVTLRYSQEYIERLCRQGKIEAVRLRNQWRIQRETVEAMLKEGGER